MRAAAILGLGCSERDLKPFQEKSNPTWLIGLPASSGEVDAILLFGGDGTVHRHLAQLVRLGRPMLVVPKGSGNDFARALKIGGMRHSLAAWRKFESGGGNVRAIDLGFITELGVTTHRLAGETPAVRGHYFCCVGGVGLDGEISRRANALPRWLRGHGGYVFSMPAAVMQLAAFPMNILEPDPQGTDAFVTRSSGPVVVATFANTPVYGGGMKIAPKALLDDGLLDICVVKDINKFKLFCLFPTIYFGRHTGLREVEYFQAARLRIETEKPFDVYADGEYVCQTPVEVAVARAALQVIVP
jgi:diacylglycerol kinase (ATP)